MTKLGRNDPCHCGSGRKYKRCHLKADRAFSAGPTIPFERLPSEVREKILTVHEDREALIRMGIRINYVRPVLHQGKKAWGVGSRLYFTSPTITFHEFTIGILSDTLGKEWWAAQRQLPEEGQHFLTKCFDEYTRWRGGEGHEEVSPGVYAGTPNGYVHHLASVAFDVVTLTHTQSLPDELLVRLKHHDQYQGARYELGIAAIFSRLDFEVRFITRDDAHGKPHPEFIASDRRSDVKVAVEVKSKHRPGVINYPGEFEEAEVRANVSRQLNEALQQNPGDIPFLIFIDINVPPTAGLAITEKPWFRDIGEILGRQHPFAVDDPDPASALTITNYSQHYEREASASAGEHVVSVSHHVRFPLPDDFLRDLNNALSAYGNVPSFDLES